MKVWLHIENGVVVGAMSALVPRDELARELGEWVLMGVTPVLYEGDEPVRVNAPPPAPQPKLL